MPCMLVAPPLVSTMPDQACLCTLPEIVAQRREDGVGEHLFQDMIRALPPEGFFLPLCCLPREGKIFDLKRILTLLRGSWRLLCLRGAGFCSFSLYHGKCLLALKSY